MKNTTPHISIYRLLAAVLLAAWLLAACLPQTTAATLSGSEAVSLPTAVPDMIVSDEPIGLDWMIVSHPEDGYWQLETGLPGADKFNGQLVRLAPRNGTPAYNVYFFYSKKSSAYDTALSTILTEFRNRDVAAAFTVVNVAYDSKDIEGSLARFDQAVQLAQQGQADLIFSAGSDGTAVFFDHYANLGIPIVSVNAKDPVLLGQMPDYTAGSGTSMAFTSLNVPIDLQMNYLRQLMPNIQNIAIMYSIKNKSAIETQANPVRAAAEAQGIKVIDVVVEVDEAAKEELAAKVPLAVAEMQKTDPGMKNSFFLITGDTTVFREIPLINQYADQIPVLSVVPENVQAGEDSAVLAIGVSFVSNAQVAAYYGAEILGGADPGSFKVGIVSPPDIAINFKRARQIGLKVPFTFFESASFVYDGEGQLVRKNGQNISPEGVMIFGALPTALPPTPTPLPPTAVPTETPLPEVSADGAAQAATPEPTRAPAARPITAENVGQLTPLNQLRQAGGSLLVLAPDNQTLAVYSPVFGQVTLYDLDTLALLRVIPTNRVLNLAFSPDSSLLAAASFDATIDIYQVGDGTLLHQFTGLGRAASGLAFSPAGDILASASPSGISLWPLPASLAPVAGQAGAEDQAPRTLPDAKGEIVSFAPDGQSLLSSSGNQVHIHQLADNSLLLEVTRGKLIAVSADGQQFASGIDGGITVFATQDGAHLIDFAANGSVDWHFGVFSPDGSLFAIIDRDDDNRYWIQLWSLSERRLVQSLGGDKSPLTNLAFSTDGENLISISEDQIINVWGLPK